jgi:hypothetical protein
MKSLSASIVVFTGAAMFVAGAFHHHNETQLVTCGAGLVVGLMGLVGWIGAMKSRD